jgi:hypothetical protein
MGVEKNHSFFGGANTFRRVFDTSRIVKVKNDYKGIK